ncbi:hypothetical protein CR513_18630, partial [Mucuna pruriens]
MLTDRSMIDAVSGGALMDKTPAVARHLILNMASNTQQFRIRGAITNKAVNEVGTVDNLRMENQLIELTSLWSTSQLANSVIQLQSVESENLPSQPIPNHKGGNVSVVTLRSGKKLQVVPRSKLNPTDTECEPEADSQVQQQAKTTPLIFPSWTISTKKPEIDEEFFKMFQRVEINIPLLTAIKQIPKYMKFLKELCIHKRNKLKEGAEVGGVLSMFIQKEVTVGTKSALPRKCRDPGIFSIPCTIGNYTFADAMSSTDPLYAFDPEIEKTLRRLRRTRNLLVNNSRSSDSVINSNQLCTDNFFASSNIFANLGQMENNDRTLKELATPDVVYQPWCIQYPQLEPTQTYELKFGLIHLLPKFHGLSREDPHKHLKEFHVVCSTMRPQGISEDYIKMKVFPFSLDGAAKDWLYLQPVLFNTWGDMKRTFLEKFFLASRTASIRKEICGIRQHIGKTLHEYWERFNKLCATCPHH